MSEKFTEFGLPTDSYAAFDATTLKSLIIERLSEKNVFTDQVFEGSNLSSIIDIVAYSYHTLLFYLNRTSSESVFTEAQLYENVNRIVKLLNYNPTGYKTSLLSFSAKGSMTPGVYTIPRYSFVDIDGIKYSTNTDISFNKQTSTEEVIESIGENNLLYQGSFEEYATQLAVGEDFETITITLDPSIKIDAFNIGVFVKAVNTDKWIEYTQVDSMFLSSPTDKVYEKRLNENMLYEIKFGNDIYGRKLTSGDQIAIYYLKSDQNMGIIGAGAMESTLSIISTKRFLQIREDIKSQNTTYATVTDLQQLILSNSSASTTPEDEESVEHIKTNAPLFFNSQNRLVTSNDFENYISKNYGNIILHNRVVSNNQYIDGHLRYLVETLGLQRPNLESRLAYNQVNFATSTNFNNVYIYAVPKFEQLSTATPLVNFLTPAQRNLIINNIDQIKAITCEPVLMDPVYMAVDLGAATPAETLSVSMRETTILNVVKSKNSQRDNDVIRQEVYDTIASYFGSAVKLNYVFDINGLYSSLSTIKDVVKIYMTREDNSAVNVDGITFLTWNPSYEHADISIVSQNKTYEYFQCPYLFDTSNMLGKIKIETSLTT